MKARLAMVVFSAVMLCVSGPAYAEKTKKLATQKEKLSYSIGLDMGKNMKAELDRQSIDIDPDTLAKGLRDALAGAKLLLTEEEILEVRTAFQNEIKAKNAERTKALAEKNKKEGPAFLAENKKKEGVKVLPSGLQYKVLKEGKGASPKDTDMVTVNYKGTLIDGTEFDSSTRRGKPATFQLNQVISGWTEALQLMKEGSEWQIVLPPNLAYGDIGTPGGPIGPGAVLVFTIELISVGQPK